MANLLNDVVKGIKGSIGLNPDQGVEMGEPVALDNRTQQLLNAQSDQAYSSPEAIAEKLNQNQQYTGNLGQNSQQMEQQSQKMNIPKGQLEAIQNVYSREAGGDIDALKSRNLTKAKLMKADQLNRLGKTLMGQQQQAMDQYQLLTKAYTEQEAARAGAISSIFQTVSTGLGGAMGKKSWRNRQQE